LNISRPPTRLRLHKGRSEIKGFPTREREAGKKGDQLVCDTPVDQKSGKQKDTLWETALNCYVVGTEYRSIKKWIRMAARQKPKQKKKAK